MSPRARTQPRAPNGRGPTGRPRALRIRRHGSRPWSSVAQGGFPHARRRPARPVGVPPGRRLGLGYLRCCRFEGRCGVPARHSPGSPPRWVRAGWRGARALPAILIPAPVPWSRSAKGGVTIAGYRTGHLRRPDPGHGSGRGPDAVSARACCGDLDTTIDAKPDRGLPPVSRSPPKPPHAEPSSSPQPQRRTRHPSAPHLKSTTLGAPAEGWGGGTSRPKVGGVWGRSEVHTSTLVIRDGAVLQPERSPRSASTARYPGHTQRSR